MIYQKIITHKDRTGSGGVFGRSFSTNNFKKYLSKNGLVLKLDKDKSLVKRYLTAEFARQLFGEQFYYSIILKEDEIIKKAESLK